MEETPTDPILHFATQIVQIINSFGLTGILIAIGIIWFKMGMPGLRRLQPAYTEGEGEEIGASVYTTSPPIPATMPSFAPPIDMEKIERKIDNLAKEMRKIKEELTGQIAEYREEVRKSAREHELEDTKQFKEMAEQIGTLTGMLDIISGGGGRKHA